MVVRNLLTRQVPETRQSVKGGFRCAMAVPSGNHGGTVRVAIAQQLPQKPDLAGLPALGLKDSSPWERQPPSLLLARRLVVGA